MDIKIHTNISDNNNEIEIIINAPKNTNQLNQIIESIQSVSNKIDTIVGNKENQIYILQVDDIICFYAREKNNYCKTNEGEFKIRKKLYELEENLNKNQFIRISNYCIANVKHIKSFDLSKIGDIVVCFSNGEKEYVSKRRVSKVMKFLRERGN